MSIAYSVEAARLRDEARDMATLRSFPIRPAMFVIHAAKLALGAGTKQWFLAAAALEWARSKPQMDEARATSRMQHVSSALFDRGHFDPIITRRILIQESAQADHDVLLEVFAEVDITYEDTLANLLSLLRQRELHERDHLEHAILGVPTYAAVVAGPDFANDINRYATRVHAERAIESLRARGKFAPNPPPRMDSGHSDYVHILIPDRIGEATEFYVREVDST